MNVNASDRDTKLNYSAEKLIIFCLSLQIYLSQYGYLSPKARNPTSGGNLLAQEAWENAIREFQGFAGLNVTGKTDHYLIIQNDFSH